MLSIAGILVLISSGSCLKPPEPYYGREIGRLAVYAHGINGTAYAVDEGTIYIKGFSYDGTGPDAFFWVGKSPRPSPDGIIVPYPEDYVGRDPPVLRAYNNTDVILKLPMGKRIRDIRWLSVWCRRFTIDFGEVFIPQNLEVPKPRILPEFKRIAHGLRSDNISILDARTFYIPNLHYDESATDAYFYVGNGPEPNHLGIRIPNETGSLEKLRGYQGEDIEIQLPPSLTVYDIDWLAVWCVQDRLNYGHVRIPKDLDVPPALGQTKISTSTSPRTTTPGNCRQFLDNRLQVRWELNDDQLDIQLSAKIREDQYMAFGISGAPNRPQMVGGDAIIAFYDTSTETFQAVDYYLSNTAQCDGKTGVCPDERIGGRNDVTLISGERRNGITSVKFSRPLKTNEAINDQQIPDRGEVSVIAALGPLNSRKEADAHSITDNTCEDLRIDFRRIDDNDCPVSLEDVVDEDAAKTWPHSRIIGETVFTASIGPASDTRGYYTPIPGQTGMAWYLNMELMPELTLERGQTYTFIIQGGADGTEPTRYHPFYITDSEEGGFGQKTAEEQRTQKVFAGVAYDDEGYPYPTHTGRYCEWTHERIEMVTLRLPIKCDQGEPGILNWTVPMDAPDLLYYQCYIHNNMGWKIHIVDPGYISERNSNGQVNGARARHFFLVYLITISLLMSSRSIQVNLHIL